MLQDDPAPPEDNDEMEKRTDDISPEDASFIQVVFVFRFLSIFVPILVLAF